MLLCVNSTEPVEEHGPDQNLSQGEAVLHKDSRVGYQLPPTTQEDSSA